jgi:hypothetical protein
VLDDARLPHFGSRIALLVLEILKKKKKQFSPWSQILLLFFVFIFFTIILAHFEHCGVLLQTTVSLGVFF